jgi:Zn-dependent peptidase ImmA (M78 family)
MGAVRKRRSSPLKGIPKRRRNHLEMDEEANVFALYLLMPRKFFEEELDKIGLIDIDDDSFLDDLAKKFRVTRGAVLARLRLRRRDAAT